MKIRLYDKFDHNETVCVLDGVKNVSGNKIVFEDGTTDEEYLDNNTDWEEIPDERIDSIEKYKDCFQPKSDEKPNSYPDEEVAKAFQIGLAFGFAKRYDEMDKVIEEVKKAATPKPETVTEFADHCRECGAKYGKMFDQKTEHLNIPFLMHKELEIPISECQKAYDVAIDYLRSQANVRGVKSE